VTGQTVATGGAIGNALWEAGRKSRGVKVGLEIERESTRGGSRIKNSPPSQSYEGQGRKLSASKF